jgi:large subunit ribosomal protein L35
MPKMKTHKAGAKRYHVTASGKLVRHQSGRNHINTHKSSARKRRLDAPALVHPANFKKVALQLPYLNAGRG